MQSLEVWTSQIRRFRLGPILRYLDFQDMQILLTFYMDESYFTK